MQQNRKTSKVAKLVDISLSRSRDSAVSAEKVNTTVKKWQARIVTALHST